MSLFTIDKVKCKGEGICAAECPIGIIEIDEHSKLPVAVEGTEKACINCGHCVSICPYGAFSLLSMPAEQCAQLPEGWNLSPQQMEFLLKGRRSVRRYKNDNVGRDVLEKVIDIARFYPSGINLQPVHWLILYDTKRVQQLSKVIVDWMRAMIREKSALAESFHMQRIVSACDRGEDRICRNAPHLVITYALKDDMTALQASTIALTYLELSAVSFGLGTCWAGYVHMAINMCPEAFELVGIPKRCGCFGAMMIGYPKFNYFRIPLRNKPQITWR